MSPTLESLCAGFARRIVDDGSAPAFACVVAKDGHRVETCAGAVWASCGDHVPTVTPTADTVFDVASLTKVVAVWPLIAILRNEGLLTLDAPSKKLGPLAGRDAGSVTVREILTHTAHQPTRSSAGEYSDPRLRAVYANHGYVQLGRLIEGLTGRSLAVCARERVWSPLGMSATTFGPVAVGNLIDGIAATKSPQAPGGGYLCGTVHDLDCRRMGGVCGNAGVFSTLRDLETFLKAMASGALTAMTGADFYRAALTPTALWRGATRFRSLGWAVETRYANNVVFHDGFTGVSVYFVPATGDHAVLLTNAVYVDPRGAVLNDVREELMRILGS